MTLTKTPELQRYFRELRDPFIFELSSVEEARGYYAMRMIQKDKKISCVAKIPACPIPKENVRNLVTEAYIQTFCHRKKLRPKGEIKLNSATQNTIYKLYLSGVLPVRLGGINI